MIIIIISFIIGIFLKNKKLGETLIKFNFYFLLPILIFYIFNNVNFSFYDLIYPLYATIIIGITFLFGNFFLFRNYPKKIKGVLVIAPMIMNIGAVYPIILNYFSEYALKYVSLFDLGNGFITLTFTYYIAMLHGSSDKKSIPQIRKIIFSPPLIAIFLGSMFNLSGVKISAPKILHIMKILLSITIYLSLGCFFEIKNIFCKEIYIANLLRFILGGLIILTLNKIFPFPAKILLLCGCAPCGFNTVTFAVLEKWMLI